MSGHRRKKLPVSEPLPRTALAPICPLLAAVIREQRTRRGWSKNELARYSGLSQPMIRYIETGTRIPTVDSLARLSRALGVDVSRLMVQAERRLR